MRKPWELTQAIRVIGAWNSITGFVMSLIISDNIKTKSGNHSQIMALLRGLAIELIRKTSPKNFYGKDVCSYPKSLAVPIS